MALQLSRYVSAASRNFTSHPPNRTRFVANIPYLSAASAGTHRFRHLRLKTPEPIPKHFASPAFSVSNSASPAEPTTEKWEGKASAKVPGVSPDRVWASLADFSSVHKWLPNIDSSRVVDGEPGQLGCVRYCTGPPIPGSESPSFTNEKLVAFDPAQMALSYEVTENNVGFGKYVATIKVKADSDGSSTIEWSFEAKPVPFWSKESILGYIGFSVQGMAKMMEEALKDDK